MLPDSVSTFQEAEQKWIKIPVGKAKNIIGQKYGRLTILYRVQPPKTITTKKPHSYWLCQCECGNFCITAVDRLNSGNIQSCGCLLREKSSERFGINITGQKFGKLTVIERDYEKSIGEKIYWKCKCDCGNPELISISGVNLRNGKRTQCSLCMPKSLGEETIRKILLNNKINFTQGHMFEDCRFPNTNRKARFDFFVNNSYIIEFDGLQHSYEGTGKCSNWWSLDYVQSHDQFKNEYCFKNNIPIIRIPYYHKDHIKLKDLLPETSKYLVKEGKKEKK